MDARTAKALEGSIEKWVDIEEGRGADRRSKNCPLCHMFALSMACWGCPVMVKTGKMLCHGSPYIKWADHQADHHGAAWRNCEAVVACPECKRLAKNERVFLERLRAPVDAPPVGFDNDW